MQKHPHTTPYKTIYSNKNLALYVFRGTQHIRDGRDNSKGTTKGKENIVHSPRIPTDFIERILGEYREGFLYL